jgi:hypothetical protein
LVLLSAHAVTAALRALSRASRSALVATTQVYHPPPFTTTRLMGA